MTFFITNPRLSRGRLSEAQSFDGITKS